MIPLCLSTCFCLRHDSVLVCSRVADETLKAPGSGREYEDAEAQKQKELLGGQVWHGSIPATCYETRCAHDRLVHADHGILDGSEPRRLFDMVEELALLRSCSVQETLLRHRGYCSDILIPVGACCSRRRKGTEKKNPKTGIALVFREVVGNFYVEMFVAPSARRKLHLTETRSKKKPKKTGSALVQRELVGDIDIEMPPVGEEEAASPCETQLKVRFVASCWTVCTSGAGGVRRHRQPSIVLHNGILRSLPRDEWDRRPGSCQHSTSGVSLASPPLSTGTLVRRVTDPSATVRCHCEGSSGLAFAYFRAFVGRLSGSRSGGRSTRLLMALPPKKKAPEGTARSYCGESAGVVVGGIGGRRTRARWKWSGC